MIYASSAVRLLQLSEDIDHLDQAAGDLPTFVSGLGAGTFDRLVDGIGSQHPERNRQSDIVRAVDAHHDAGDIRRQVAACSAAQIISPSFSLSLESRTIIIPPERIHSIARRVRSIADSILVCTCIVNIPMPLVFVSITEEPATDGYRSAALRCPASELRIDR